jgi:penicillin-binding protein 1C
VPVPGLVGRAVAAPILFDAFARLPGLPVALPKAPRGAIFATNNRLPLPLQRFRPGVLAGDKTDTAPRIVFPPNGARLELAGGELAELALKVSGGVQPLTLVINGVPQTAQASRRTLFFAPDGPGFARLTVMDARGVVDSVVVRIE